MGSFLGGSSGPPPPTIMQMPQPDPAANPPIFGAMPRRKQAQGGSFGSTILGGAGGASAPLGAPALSGAKSILGS